MYIECNTSVDYLFQQRKPTKQSTKGITLFRNSQSQICLVIGKGEKKGSTQFRLEESLSKIYSNFIQDGKLTIELKLAGGSSCNVLISKCNVNQLTELVRILNIIENNPEQANEIDLRQFSNNNKESGDDEDYSDNDNKKTTTKKTNKKTNNNSDSEDD